MLQFVVHFLACLDCQQQLLDMDPIDYKLRQYSEIPITKSHQLAALAKSRNVVTFKALVIDFTDFDHPGSNRTIESFQGKDITHAYQSKQHSFNADLIVCHKVIGKLQHSCLQNEGKEFYESVRCSLVNIEHENILSRINFQKPLLSQISKLNSRQLKLLTEIPKLFKHPQKVIFKANKLDNFIYEQHFWISIATFISYVLLIACWMMHSFEMHEIFEVIPLLLIGGGSYTLIQYFFHKSFHQNMDNMVQLRSHLMHHAFPNLNNKVAISIGQNTLILIVVAVVLRFFISELVIGMLFMGLISTLVLYDCIHYYCHFGPQTNIGVINYLRVNHLKHHFRNPDKYFGVTNTFWDWVFGTAETSPTPKHIM